MSPISNGCKKKTISEQAFEVFCQANNIDARPIPEEQEKTPDYALNLSGIKTYVEVKQIDEDENFSSCVVQTRIPGSHVRKKIKEAEYQLRKVSQSGAPTFLLIYNNLDPVQMFGTEQHDFLAAMYGELTTFLSKNGNQSPRGLFHGRNQSCREDNNVSISAVGLLFRGSKGYSVELYENYYARVPLDSNSLPPAIQFYPVQIQQDE